MVNSTKRKLREAEAYATGGGGKDVESSSDDESGSDYVDESAEDDEGGQGIDSDHDGKGRDDRRGDDEMEQLEKEYMDLRNKESDVLETLKRHKDEDVLKGHAVKNQKALWDRTLELRFLIQKAFTSSNQLPQEPLRTSFCETDKKVDEAFKELLTSTKETLNSILELQEALLHNNPAIAPKEEGSFAESSKKHLKDLNKLGDDCGEEWEHILEMHRRMTPFRDKSVDKWYRKTQVTTGAAAMKNKLHAFNQNISEQVSSHMRDPRRMIKQMQQRRSTVHIFGSEVLHCAETSEKEEPNAEGDPELLNDAEFYQQLLKEFFETLNSTSSDAAIYAFKRLQTKKRKIVDRRASKSRKIRYNVHEKLVNFMAPQPTELPPMAPKLFENLFGLKTMKSPNMVLFFKQEMELFLVGLQNAGKTSLVNAIATGGYSEDMIPTVDFNMRKVTKGNVTIKLWDLGGQRRFRFKRERYCPGVSAIVYVVDAADRHSIPIVDDIHKWNKMKWLHTPWRERKKKKHLLDGFSKHWSTRSATISLILYGCCCTRAGDSPASEPNRVNTSREGPIE